MAKLILKVPTFGKKRGDEIEATGEAAEALVRNGSARRKAAAPKSSKD